MSCEGRQRRPEQWSACSHFTRTGDTHAEEADAAHDGRVLGRGQHVVGGSNVALGLTAGTTTFDDDTLGRHFDDVLMLRRFEIGWMGGNVDVGCRCDDWGDGCWMGR